MPKLELEMHCSHLVGGNSGYDCDIVFRRQNRYYRPYVVEILEEFKKILASLLLRYLFFYVSCNLCKKTYFRVRGNVSTLKYCLFFFFFHCDTAIFRLFLFKSITFCWFVVEFVLKTLDFLGKLNFFFIVHYKISKVVEILFLLLVTCPTSYVIVFLGVFNAYVKFRINRLNFIA